ncbi:unnamed protein product [Notodromas monacha]|uniref:Centrosomal protein of 97 kDa n=1 Tax=Notodromas monacha TaxID=399045 RepID=A0A7R9BK84_9CRUS|nr:unnamed protein product [Notodromas monacha]CAG0916178.1 unnamed protein product [Notodromas monacha]
MSMFSEETRTLGKMSEKAEAAPYNSFDNFPGSCSTALNTNVTNGYSERGFLSSRVSGEDASKKDGIDLISDQAIEDPDKWELEQLYEESPELRFFENPVEVGRGAFSTVFVANPIGQAKKVVLKKLKRTSHIDTAANELQYLLRLGGKHHVPELLCQVRNFDSVIFVMPFLRSTDFNVSFFCIDTLFCFVYSSIVQCSQTWISNPKMDEVKDYFRNLFEALNHVHSFGIMHRDVKPGNFLFNRESRRCLLIDFGLAQYEHGKAPIEEDEDDEFTDEELCSKPRMSTPLRELVMPQSQDSDTESIDSCLNLSLRERLIRRDSANSQRIKECLELMDKQTKARKKRISKENPKDSDLFPSFEAFSSKNAHIFERFLPRQGGERGLRSYLNRFAYSRNKADAYANRPGANKDAYLFLEGENCPCLGEGWICEICREQAQLRAPRGGTPGFRAPEVLLKSLRQTTAIDIWSAGVMLLAVLSKRYPFFTACDDAESLVEIAGVFGTEAVAELGDKCGKVVTFDVSSGVGPPLDLRALTLVLRPASDVYVEQSSQCKFCRVAVSASGKSGCLCVIDWKRRHLRKMSPTKKRSSKAPLHPVRSSKDVFPDSVYDLLAKLLAVDPKERLTARMSGEIDDEPLECLDLSGKELKKVPPAACDHYNVTTLSLNHNELQRLENVDTYGNLLKLTATHNSISRMYALSRMYSLRHLDLSFNSITAIEGLRELVHLEWLSLSGNNIKTVEHLNTNTALKYLDLSSNCISSVTDLKNLRNLRTLYLHDNHISDLKFCDRFLPKETLIILTLQNNRIADLCQAYYLKNFVGLKKLSFYPNPCLQSAGEKTSFDYRPFLINWCMQLHSLDGIPVGEHELLKAEWLYSQGKGRHFPPSTNKHKELVEYLIGCCPMANEEDHGDPDGHLERVLMKAREHQTKGNDLGKTRPLSAENDVDDPNGRRRRKREQVFHSSSRSVSAVVAPIVAAKKISRPTSHSRSSSISITPCSSPRVAKENGVKVASKSSTIPSSSTKSNKSHYDVSLSPAIYTDPSTARRNRGLWHVDLMAQSCHVDAIRDFMADDDEDETRDGFVSPPDLSISRISGPDFLLSKDDVMTRSWDPSLKISAKSPKPSGVPRPVSAAVKSGIPSVSRKPASKQNVSKIYSPVSVKTTTPSNSSARKTTSLSSQAEKKKVLQQRSMTEDTLLALTRTRSDSVCSNASAKSNRTVTLTSSRDDDEDAKKSAALSIQKIWRGYRTRNLDSAVKEKLWSLRSSRTEDHVMAMSKELREATDALKNERQMRLLMTKAIKELHKLVVGNSDASDEGGCSRESVKGCCRCADLSTQVEELQESMREMSEQLKKLTEKHQEGNVVNKEKLNEKVGDDEEEETSENRVGELLVRGESFCHVSDDALLRTVPSTLEMESRKEAQRRRPTSLPVVRVYERIPPQEAEGIEEFANQLAISLCTEVQNTVKNS